MATLVGWLLLLLFVAAGAPLLAGSIGEYSGADVVLRPWMVTSGTLVASVHLLALALLTFGSRGVVRATIGLSCAIVACQIAAPWVIGSGPHASDSSALTVFTALVFLPLLVRDVGWGLMAWRVRTRWNWLLAVFACGDAVITIIVWARTPIAVMTRPHAVMALSPLLLPFVLGGISLLVLLAMSGAGKPNASSGSSKPTTEPSK